MLKRCVERWTDEEGSALFIAMVITLMLASLCAGYLTLSTANYRNTQDRLDSLQAYYVAESGIEAALAELNTDVDPDGDGLGAITGLVAGNTFEVSTTWMDADTVRLVSAGTSGPFSRQIETVARKEVPPCFKYAIITEETLDFRGNVGVAGGDVHTNHDFLLKGGAADVDGSLSAVGKIDGKTGGVTGDVIPGAAYVPIADINLDAFRQEAIDNGTYYKGTQTWTNADKKLLKDILAPDPIGTGVKGVVFVDGDLHISGNVEGTGFVVVSGNLKIGGNVTFGTADTSVVFMSQGDMNISGNPDLQGLFYTKSSVQLRGNVGVAGALVAAKGFGSDIDPSSVRGAVKIKYVEQDNSLYDQLRVYRILVRRELGTTASGGIVHE